MQLPCVTEAETNVTLAGSVSVMVAPVASATPRFCTVTKYAKGLETNTGLGEAERVSRRSASPVIPTRTVVLEVLLEATGSLVVLEVTLVIF